MASVFSRKYIPPMRTLRRLSIPALAVAGVCTVAFAQQPQAPAPGQPAPAPPVAGGQAAPAGPGRSTNLGTDANGNPLRRALKTGHVSNYDEAKVGTYTLPDPLVLANGTPVRDRADWVNQAPSGDPAALRDGDLRPHAGEAPKVSGRWPRPTRTRATARR